MGALSMGAIGISRRFAIRDIMVFALLSSLAYLSVGIVLEVALGTFHRLGSDYRFGGTLHPNQQGLNCAILVLSGVGLYGLAEQYRKWIFAATIIGFFFLILTKSRTCFFSAALAIICYWILVGRPLLKICTALGVVSFSWLIFLFFGGKDLQSYLGYIALLGRVGEGETSTLSGRLPLWNECLHYAARHPIVGYGWGAFWSGNTIYSISSTEKWAMAESHSAYIDVLLSLGLAGMLTFILTLLGAATKSIFLYKSTKNRVYAYIFVLIVFVLSASLLETAIIETTAVSFLIIMCVVKLSQQPKVSWLNLRRQHS